VSSTSESAYFNKPAKKEFRLRPRPDSTSGRFSPKNEAKFSTVLAEILLFIFDKKSILFLIKNRFWTNC
jgi:hypothetical protein